ncbi:hypothetical protein BV25DRAFT_1915982 [Artomyces pyxidatus]|uniref:Uncharacterized protein n=1 Tax=Artomyces pyxidatus TaxID=48021 RepID=A0ACB8T178_9AGAM|nr:hypothetical protein BV25DRAFT_1915982 [Artomyces pyxidatus]
MLSRSLYVFLSVYIFVSVVYTSAFLVLCPVLAECSSVFALRFPSLADIPFLGRYGAPSGGLMIYEDNADGRSSSGATRLGETDDLAAHLEAIAADSVLSWPTHRISPMSSDELGTASRQYLMPESLFLSKAFSNSMHPMKIIPFFYRASERFDEDDITITTLVTSNRFEVLQNLAKRYDGPLSVTVHLPVAPDLSPLSASSTLSKNLTALHSLLLRSPALAARADVHVVLSPFPRAFNTWRNVARFLARTTYVLLLDVDFAVCTDWRAPVRALLRAEDGEMARRMRAGSAALVLPAFEYVKAEDGRDHKAFPRDKRTLLDLVRARKVAPFHASWAPGHNSTDYKRFYAARPGEIYRVTTYQSAYEPYVIVKRDAGGWCDERFTGYGGNKAACLFDMYLSGVSFYVLSDHYLIHQSHAYEEEARRNERKYNRKIYSDFKEETCLRYLKRFQDEGVLNTSRGYNAQEECRKIKGIGKIVTQLLDDQ